VADTALVSTQNSQIFAFYVPFLDRFSGFRHPIEALQHFFSSLLGASGGARSTGKNRAAPSGVQSPFLRKSCRHA